MDLTPVYTPVFPPLAVHKAAHYCEEYIWGLSMGVKTSHIYKCLCTKTQTNCLGFDICFTTSSTWRAQVASPFKKKKKSCFPALVSMWVLRLLVYVSSKHNRLTFTPNFATTNSECTLSSRILHFHGFTHQKSSKCFTLMHQRCPLLRSIPLQQCI